MGPSPLSLRGGAVLPKACDERLGLTERIAACFRDERQPGKITHTLHDLIRQRVFAIACGYADCNDAARLVDDPIHKLLLGRDARPAFDLAGPATLADATRWRIVDTTPLGADVRITLDPVAREVA